MKEPSEIIIQSRRCVDEFDQITLLHDLTWDEYEQVWFLHFRNRILSESQCIPKETEWYLTMTDRYPEGKVQIYPSIENGITDTYYHQANNGKVSGNNLWRKGVLCLKNPLDEVAGIDQEPFDEFKLLWNLQRFIIWIEKANSDTLVSNGDFFELPDVNTKRKELFVFDEDMVSFMQWEEASECYGTVTMKLAKGDKIFVDTFIGAKGSLCKDTAWGSNVSAIKSDDYIGIWMLFKQIPVINRWQVPKTYEELEYALELQGVALKEILFHLLDKIRDGKRHPLLVGFPIPERFGDKPSSYFWWACILPKVSYKGNVQRGYRPNRTGWIMRDFSMIFKNSMQLEWSRSENWNPSQITRRGMFGRSVLKNRYIIVGAGAIGCVIAEQLVRSGVNQISIIDGDLLSVGNLARHSLTIDDIDQYKSVALANRLNKINGHVRAKAITAYLNDSNVNILNHYDVIIDCTAKDYILKLMSQLKINKIICSVSVGYKVERIYLLYYRGNQFTMDFINDKVKEFIENDKLKIIDDELPWDGIGCWNPVFPANSCDMSLAGSLATIVLTELISQHDTGSRCFVYQKKYDENGLFIGYERI